MRDYRFISCPDSRTVLRQNADPRTLAAKHIGFGSVVRCRRLPCRLSIDIVHQVSIVCEGYFTVRAIRVVRDALVVTACNVSAVVLRRPNRGPFATRRIVVHHKVVVGLQNEARFPGGFPVYGISESGYVVWAGEELLASGDDCGNSGINGGCCC